jgi:DNA polymerase-3 subunit delta
MAKAKSPPQPKGISLKKLEDQLAAGKPADVYLLAGKEALLHQDALQILRTYLFPEPSTAEFDMDLVYGDQVTAEDLATRVATSPFLSKRRLVVVRRAEQLKDAPKVLGEEGSPCRGASVLVLDYSPGKTAPARLSGTRVDLAPPKDHALPAWLRERAQRKNLHLTHDAIECLIGLIGPPPDRAEESTILSDLDNELEKLCLFAREGQPVDREDVAAVVGSRPDQSLYAFSKAVLHCRVPEATTIAEALTLNRRYVEAALPQIGLDLLRLMRLKAALDEGAPPGGLAKAAGVWRGWATEWTPRAHEVSWAWLWHMSDLAYRADRDVKRGIVDLPRSIELLIASAGSGSECAQRGEG